MWGTNWLLASQLWCRDPPHLQSEQCPSTRAAIENLVDPASSHMLCSRAKPCMSESKRFNSGSVNGSLHQQSSL